MLENQCDGNSLNEDCYTCSNTNTEYCYIEGNTYYTASIDETSPVEIPLNGISWEELKTAFEENCINSQTTNLILGEWNMIGFNATIITKKTPVGTTNTTTLTEYHEGTNYNYTMSITDNPNELQYSGDFSFTITGDSEWGSGATTAGTAIFEWSMDGNNLIINKDNYDQYVTTVLELSETILKLKIETLQNNEVDGINYEVSSEVFETYEK